jgi:hypothetical protein
MIIYFISILEVLHGVDAQLGARFDALLKVYSRPTKNITDLLYISIKHDKSLQMIN